MYLLLTLIGWAIGMVQGFFFYYVCRMLWNEGGGGVEMKYKKKVIAVKWIELDVEAGNRQPFDNFEDELSEAAIDMVIDQIQRFDVDDIEWDAEVMESTE